MPLDIGIGLLAAYVGRYYLGIDPTTALVASIVFVVLPDLDAVIQIIWRGSVHRMDHTHRDLLHRPLLYVPIGTALAALCGGSAIALLFAVLSLAHFVHDSIGTGWGIAWLRPFTRRYYKFFSRAYGDASLTIHQLVVSWTPDEQRTVAAQYGNPDWVRDTYRAFKPPYSTIFIIETSVFVIGVLVFLSTW